MSATNSTPTGALVLRAVPFHGDTIRALQDEQGKVWVPLRVPCQVLGLDFNGQRQRLKRQAWATACIMHAVASDGKQRQICCLDLDSFPMWLATIDAGRVSKALRPKLELYQKEAARVLRDHFLGTKRTDPIPRDPLESVKGFLQVVTEVLSLGGMEARDRVLLKDFARNRLLLNRDEAANDKSVRFVTIPERCVELGYPRPARGQDCQIGKCVARHYRRNHDGRDPEKHEQTVDGRVVLVNTYTEADLDVVDAGIHEWHQHRLRIC